MEGSSNVPECNKYKQPQEKRSIKFFSSLNIVYLLSYYYPIISHFCSDQKNIPLNFILRYSIISRGSWVEKCQLSSYLPGSEDTVISKAVPSGRDFSIALRGGWSLRFPLMWGTREHNLWELGTAFALSPYQPLVSRMRRVYSQPYWGLLALLMLSLHPKLISIMQSTWGGA